MTRKLLFVAPFLAVLLLVPAGAVRSAGPADAYGLKVAAGAPPAELPAALRDAVGAETLQVSTSAGPLCEIWLRKEVPITASPSQDLGVTFGQIAEGTLLGVMLIAQDTKDYRDQKVKAGLYTLRYAFAPVDGNHTGIAPQRDFALLSPVAEDADPATITREEALKRSAKTTGTKHPSVWSLWPGEDSAAGPALRSQEESQTWLLTFRLSLAGGTKVSMGMVVVGHAPEA
jgi:hypothetical protein